MAGLYLQYWSPSPRYAVRYVQGYSPLAIGIASQPLMSGLDIMHERLIAQGASGQVFLLPDNRVIKLFHPAVSDEMVEREAAISAMAHHLALPVAAPLERVESDGQRGIVYARLEGGTVLQAIRRKPWRGRKLIDAMAHLQSVVHSHCVAGLRPVSDLLDTDIRYGPAPLPLQHAACAYLRTLPDGNQFLHGDFHPGNIILTVNGPFIIDWAKASMGVPAADMVRTEMLLRFGQGHDGIMTNIWRDWAAGRIMRYATRHGAVSSADMAAWRPVVALAWLRARAPVRQSAFLNYLNTALDRVGLPVLT